MLIEVGTYRSQLPIDAYVVGFSADDPVTIGALLVDAKCIAKYGEAYGGCLDDQLDWRFVRGKLRKTFGVELDDVELINRWIDALLGKVVDGTLLEKMNRVQSLTIPEASKVWMNEQAVLKRHPPQKRNAKRLVWLEESLDEIPLLNTEDGTWVKATKNSLKRFRVTTGGLRTARCEAVHKLRDNSIGVDRSGRVWRMAIVGNRELFWYLVESLPISDRPKR